MLTNTAKYAGLYHKMFNMVVVEEGFHRFYDRVGHLPSYDNYITLVEEIDASIHCIAMKEDGSTSVKQFYATLKVLFLSYQIRALNVLHEPHLNKVIFKWTRDKPFKNKNGGSKSPHRLRTFADTTALEYMQTLYPLWKKEINVIFSSFAQAPQRLVKTPTTHVTLHTDSPIRTRLIMESIRTMCAFGLIRDYYIRSRSLGEIRVALNRWSVKVPIKKL